MNIDLGKHHTAIKLLGWPLHLCAITIFLNPNFNVKIHQTAKHWETPLYQKSSFILSQFLKLQQLYAPLDRVLQKIVHCHFGATWWLDEINLSTHVHFSFSDSCADLLHSKGFHPSINRFIWCIFTGIFFTVYITMLLWSFNIKILSLHSLLKNHFQAIHL